MSLHKMKLLFLRNRFDLISLTVATSLLVILILQAFILTATYKQSKDNERILKGLSCILLIKPDDRTTTNIAECVKINHGNSSDYKFMFETLKESSVKTQIENEPNLISLLKGQKGDTGKKGDVGATGTSGQGTSGQNGSQGVRGLDGQQGVAGEKGEQGSMGEPGVPGKEVEFRYNVSKNRIEWRYVGDDTWQILVKNCQLTNTCP